MCLSLVFIGVWLRPGARLFVTVSVLGVRTALFCLKQLKHLYSIGKVEFKEAGAGNSWASRLGYKWKHFLQSVLQDFFPFRVVNSTSCCRSLFSALFFFHPLPQTVQAASNVFIFLFLSDSNQPGPSAFPFWIRREIRNGCRLLSTSRQHHDHCLAEWRGTAGQLHYPPLIYGGREHRWMLPLAPSLTLGTQQWE